MFACAVHSKRPVRVIDIWFSKFTFNVLVFFDVFSSNSTDYALVRFSGQSMQTNVFKVASCEMRCHIEVDRDVKINIFLTCDNAINTQAFDWAFAAHSKHSDEVRLLSIDFQQHFSLAKATKHNPCSFQSTTIRMTQLMLAKTWTIRQIETRLFSI